MTKKFYDACPECGADYHLEEGDRCGNCGRTAPDMPDDTPPPVTDEARESLTAMSNIEACFNDGEAGWGSDYATIRHDLKVIRAALTQPPPPLVTAEAEGMVLVKKSSMLEPDFESMGRQILDLTKRLKAFESIAREIDDQLGDAPPWSVRLKTLLTNAAKERA